MDEPSRDPAVPALRCLRGRPPTQQIMADVNLVKTLPQPARQQLFRVLGPCLPEPVPDVQGQLDEFCREFGIAGPDLIRAVKACRFLLRQAAMTNLGTADFVADLAALGDTGEISECLLSGYEAAVKVVRLEITAGTLADHGKVVERVSWRVEQNRPIEPRRRGWGSHRGVDPELRRGGPSRPDHLADRG